MLNRAPPKVGWMCWAADTETNVPILPHSAHDAVHQPDSLDVNRRLHSLCKSLNRGQLADFSHSCLMDSTLGDDSPITEGLQVNGFEVPHTRIDARAFEKA